ncbi:Sucrose-6-phosphate hydrolase [Fusarium heterosporum]|uniref:beta-fructofuranosidase n=1 Tax=Fusarium heterosporum TaxID=42747 RepID=A0A8H5STP1_FUSHE|nr:Sucrose-6-phosphate hydrolase [Fusarium heterosporum]
MAATLVAGASLHSVKICQAKSFPGPENPSFETGDLKGWKVISGAAFGKDSISSETTYWDGPFHQNGKRFLLGTKQAGEEAVGELKSSTFRASSTLSFLVGGGYDPDHLYVALVREADGKPLLKQTATNDEALIRITWDTSKWQGEKVHILVHDSSTAESWGHINIDDVRVGCHALGDGKGLSFNILGQANQRRKGSSACSSYATDPIRPQYHYTPYQGWINDPAGLAEFHGTHHLFSQYYPEAPLWGPMHWAHAKSNDAVHWREQPVALYPTKVSNSSDDSGRFTGSGVVDKKKNELRLILTDYINLAYHPDAVQESVIMATSKDGKRFDLAKEPTIPGPPKGEDPFFRDPKVFHDPTDNKWKMAIGATNGESGQVQLYESDNLDSWSHVGVLYAADGSTGKVWECPNFFPLGDKWVLFYGGNGLGYYETGTYDGKTFKSEKRGLVDAGPSSYAMQWYQDEAGRNLAITWMANWPSPKWPSRVNGWAGQQSITREMFIRKDGGLGQRPIPELDTLASGRTKKIGATKVTPKGLHVGSSNSAKLTLDLDLTSSDATSFALSLFKSAGESVVLTFDKKAASLTLDTTNAGYGQAGKWEAMVDIADGQRFTVDVFLDRSVLEIFVNDGTVFSATVFPRYQESQDIDLVANDGVLAVKSIALTSLGSSWC